METKLIRPGRNESAETYHSQNSFPVSFANNLGRIETRRQSSDNRNNAVKEQNSSFEDQPLNAKRYMIEKIYQEDFPQSTKWKRSTNIRQDYVNDYNADKGSDQLIRPNAQNNEKETSSQFKSKQDIIRSIYMPKLAMRFTTTVKSSLSNKSSFVLPNPKEQQLPRQRYKRQILPKTKFNLSYRPTQNKKIASKTTRQKFQIPSKEARKNFSPKLNLSQVFNSMPKFQQRAVYNTSFPKLFEDQIKFQQQYENSDSQESTNIKILPKRNSVQESLSQGEEGLGKLISSFKPHTATYSQVDKSDFKIKKYKNGVYFGQLSEQDKKEGVGIIFYFNGKLYEGCFNNDMKHGKGYQLHVDSSYYEGEYSDGYKEGKGRFVWSNGEVYDGQWHRGKKHGSGMWKASGISNKSYIGEWFNGKPHGFGVYTNHVRDRYEGEFKNGLKDGHATERFVNGDLYVGQYIKGKRIGMGQYRYANGDIYLGQFCNSLKHGKGKYIEQKTKQVYEGSYRNDNISGKGQYLFSDGTIYYGFFENNLLHGQGTLTYPDNTIMQGYWINGIKVGKDVQTEQTISPLINLGKTAVDQFITIRQQRKKRLPQTYRQDSKSQSKSKIGFKGKSQNQKQSHNTDSKCFEDDKVRSYIRRCNCLGHRRYS